MATRHRITVPEQQRGGAEIPPIAGKQQKASDANRRALGDIGNLVNVNTRTGVEGKPQQPQISRPVTRSFGAQLLRNAQAAAEAAVIPKKKPAKVDAEGPGKAVVPKPKPRVAAAVAKPKPEAVIEISPGTVEASAKKERSSSSRKKVHAFSSVLTARSKAACGISSKPAEAIPNIDASDVGDQLAVVDYVEDIYTFYKQSEKSYRPQDYMSSQAEINSKMRAILTDWLIEVHHKFELMPETLYLTVYIIDRYLSLDAVPRRELQLVGMSAMLIACKYEEIWAPEVNDFICISDMAYSREQILAKEKGILDKLEWNLTVPTPYVFIVRFLKAALSDKEMEQMVFFFAELGLMQYTMMIPYCSSMVAAASVYAARCTLNRTPLWTQTLERHTGFSEPDLKECAKLLVEFHSTAAESKLKAVYKKYSNPMRGAVALHSAATKMFGGSSSSSSSLGGEPSAAAC